MPTAIPIAVSNLREYLFFKEIPIQKKATQLDSFIFIFENIYLKIVLNKPTIKAPAKDSPLVG